MSIVNRISVMFRAKVLGMVDSVEDPRETLSYACHRQEELLSDVRRSLIEVSASKHQLSAQIERLEKRVPQLDDQARRAVAAGREDLARQSLERRQLADRQLQDLREQLAGVEKEEQKLRQAERRFAAAVDAFRTRKDLLSAKYTAAEAQCEAQKSLAGLSCELNGIGDGIQRAESKIERMQARAMAIDELLSNGVFEGMYTDHVEEELRRHDDKEEVERRLAELKAQAGKGEKS